MRRLATFVVSVPVVVLLSACQAQVTTSVDVAGTSATGRLQVVVSDEAAKALLSSPATDQALMEDLARRSGTTVTRSADENTITYETALPVGNEISSVSGVALEPVSFIDDRVVVRARLVRPNVLAAAYADSVAGAEDAAARVLVMEKSTSLCLRVSTPAPPTSVTYDGPVEQVSRDGSTTTICTPMEGLVDRSVTVTAPAKGPFPMLYAGAAGVLMLFLAGLFYRRSLKR